jgi:hypothetical protein
VSSINRVTATPTNATSLQWTVTFAESVTGVGTADFALANSGLTSPSITGISGSGTTYTVTASTGTGNGTLGLNLVDDDSIVDGAGNKLGGTGTGNGNFTGQVYTVDKTVPTATNITLNNAASGGTLGRAGEDDTVVITYSETMDATTFCSTWSNSGTQTLSPGSSLVVAITDNGANDTLSVSNSSGCTVHVGTVALNANYVSSTVNFSGNGSNSASLQWNPSTNQLTITLGTGTGQNSSVAASIPSNTPDAALKDLAGNLIASGPFTGTSSRF